MFFPSEPGNSLAFVELTSLLPDYQAALNEARTATGWDPQKLNQIVAHEYGFLGAFISARVETVTRETGQTAEYLVVEFRPPQDRDLEKAERLFQKVTRRANQGDVRGALPDLKRLVAQFPEVAKYHQILGLAHLELENLDAAEDELLRALRLDPRLDAALTTLANVYQKRGKPDLAIPLYRRSIELRPTAYALSNLGAVLAQTGDLPQAITVLTEATRVDPAFPKAWYGLGLALYKTGEPARFPSALDALDKALAVIGDRKREASLWDTT
jgi:tetratricopeptide (TPR) repeat protein